MTKGRVAVIGTVVLMVLGLAGPVDAQSPPAHDPTVPDPAPFVQVSAGSNHACGLTDAGQAWCWGDDGGGALGNGATTGDQVSPSAVEMPPGVTFTQISVGTGHTCALASDGTPWCWGNDVNGALGNGADGTQASPDAVEIGALPAGTRFVQLSAGQAQTCGVTGAGTAYCWGSEASGELGDGGGAASTQQTPVIVTPLPAGTTLAEVHATFNHVCARTTTGTAFCWGADTDGQLGNGATAGAQASPSPVTMPANTQFTAIAALAQTSCAVSGTGTAFCWGSDGFGRLGNGATTGDQPIPVAVDPSTVPAGTSYTAITPSASAVSVCALTAAGTAYCWGHDGFGQLGNGGGGDAVSPGAVDLSPLPTGATLERITTAASLTCAATTAGQAWCWGSDQGGQLGNGAATGTQHVPSAVDTAPLPLGTAFVAVSAGRVFACGLTGTGHVYCWGGDGSGQLGNGAASTGSQDRPSPIDASPLPAGTRFVAISAGGTHACGLTGTGTAWCWGSDSAGELGNGALGAQPSPSPVEMPAATTFRSIEAGSSHTCAVSGAGGAYCWGSDTALQLGNGAATTADQPSPSAVVLPAATTFVQVAAGLSHTCAVSGGGDGFCWGTDDEGQLGNAGTVGSQAAPDGVNSAPLPPGLRWESIDVGARYSCGVSGAGTAWCWGRDDAGQLGNGAALTVDQISPSPVDAAALGGAGFVAIAPGLSTIDSHTCGVTATGAGSCWGRDGSGQVGDGTASQADKPSATLVDLSTLPAGGRLDRRDDRHQLLLRAQRNGHRLVLGDGLRRPIGRRPGHRHRPGQPESGRRGGRGDRGRCDGARGVDRDVHRHGDGCRSGVVPVVAGRDPDRGGDRPDADLHHDSSRQRKWCSTLSS